MKKFNFEKFLADSKGIKLNPAEKTEIFNYLKSLTQERPVRKPDPSGPILWSNNINIFKLNFKTMPLIIAIAILLSGGAAVGAENSLPGDALYPVKVSVNERVGSWIAVSDKAQANWDARVSVRRLEEAEKLAVGGRLNEEIRLKLEERFQRHADKVSERIAMFGEKDISKSLETTSNFQASLDAHIRIMNNIGVSIDGEAEPLLLSLSETARNARANILRARSESETEIRSSARTDVQSSAEGKLKSAENKIAEVEKFIADNSDDLDSEAAARVEARLDLAKQAIEEGKEKLEAGVYGEAFIMFQRAHMIAQEAKLLVVAKLRFEGPLPPEEELEPTPTPESNDDSEIESSPTPEPNSSQNQLHLRGRVRIDLGL